METQMRKETKAMDRFSTRKEFFRAFVRTASLLIFISVVVLVSLLVYEFRNADELRNGIILKCFETDFGFLVFVAWLCVSVILYTAANNDVDMTEENWFPPRDLFFYKFLVMLLLFPLTVSYFLFCFVKTVAEVAVMVMKKG